MKVKDLIIKLQKFDPELQVLIANEEEEIIGKGNIVKFFDISHISSLHAETQRHQLNRNVEFTFVGIPTKYSQEFVFIDVVSQF
ncbi:MAG: hypothetical protein LBV35_02155 [Acinetobacter sp.]|jgi:hypothetical protein|uniref:hypothetical protein n=1 Tax=Acinetobacter sp. TaxID=472 RepID=UPI002849F908|nr:hypothetical protein [Acinetobacter sp.]MDR3027242.1 hypothetical protein [Acinetobacter sp.]